MPDRIEPKYTEQMNVLAGFLDDTFNGTSKPKKIAFVLLTAEFDKIDGGRVNYISNGPRDDMLSMMKEMIARAEGRYVEEGGNA